MNHVRRMLIGAAAAWLVAATATLLWAQTAQPQTGMSKSEESAKLVATLRSADAPLFDKAKACQRLAVIGGKDAVPALAALLSEEKLAHYARFGLEPIPDPAVDEALRDALGKLRGKLLVGVLNSIGVRKDAQAADALTRLLGNSDGEVAAAAAAALGRIGNAQTAQTLQQALTTAPAIRPAVADACLACAEALAAKGQRDGAIALYDAVRKAEVPKYVQTAATRRAIISRESAALPLLLEQLKASDPAMFAVALGACRELTGGAVTQALVVELDKLPVGRQALLIQALGDRGDAAALPAVLKAAAASAPPQLRLAAVRVLPRLGNASAVPVLLDAASGSDEELAQAAQAGLIVLKGKEVDAALLAALGSGDNKVRRVVIESVGQRRVTAAVPTLISAADDADPPIRIAAIKGLGETITAEQLPLLINRVVAPAKTAEDAAAAKQALKAACARVPDRDACAAKLMENMPKATVEAKCSLLELLGSVGGMKALKAVSASARDANDQVQDVATRVLGEWMSADAAPELLELAKSGPNSKFRLRALRGYIRIARQLDLPADQRVAMCVTAIATAQRDDEKKLVFEVLTRNPSPGALKLAVAQLGSPGLKEDAAAAAVSIAEKILKTEPAAVAEAMPRVLAAGVSQDVTDRAKTLANQGKRRAQRK